MLDTVVMSGDDVCCSVVFGTLVGVFVFCVMWLYGYVDLYPSIYSNCGHIIKSVAL